MANSSMDIKAESIGSSTAKETEQDASIYDIEEENPQKKHQWGWFVSEFLHLLFMKEPIHRTGKCNMRKGYNFFGKWSFSYMDEMIKRGYRRDLKLDEFPSVEPEDQALYVSNKIIDSWDKEVEKRGKDASLIRASLKAFWVEMLIAFTVTFIENAFTTAQGFALGKILVWFQMIDSDDTVSVNDGYYWTLFLSICIMAHATLHHATFFLCVRFGLQLRVAFIAVIYRKALKLSTFNTSSTGYIVNLVSNDVQRFEEAGTFFPYIILSPIQLGVATYLIYLQISWSAFATVGLLLLMIPLQSYFAKLFMKFRTQMLVFRDERIKSISDMLSGITVVKLYAWEFPFMEKVKKIRDLELLYTLKANSLRAINEAIYFVAQALTSLLGFGVFFATGGDLIPSVVFSTLTYMAAVRLNMANFFPRSFQFISEAIVSFRRIEEFLKLENLKLSGSVLDNKKVKDNIVVSIDNSTFEWLSETPILNNINLSLKKGTLTVICGPVGSGKSSLLNAIMGELPPVSGTVSMVEDTKIAYASQLPWITAGTIKDNILFGLKYDETRFKNTIRLTSMVRDITLFENGVNTVIGERGVSLSGGQKARLSLARAVYANRDLYLLDDPLSAVDTKVSKHLFEKCIKEGLKDKIVVLVTHQLQVLPSADRIIVLENGHITADGDWATVSKVASPFCVTLANFNKKMENDEVSTEDIHVEEDQHNAEIILTEKLSKVLKIEGEGILILDENKVNIEENEDDIDLTESNELLHQDEEAIKSGNIGGKIYYEYFKIGTGLFGIFTLFFLMIAGEVTNDASSYWLSHWTQMDFEDKSSNRNIWIFFALVITTLILAIFRAIVFFWMCWASTKQLFNRMLDCVFMTGSHFFHTNPHGRIMNRFSKDIGLLDETLPLTFFDFMQETFMIIGVLVISAIAIPPFLVLVPFILYGCVVCRNLYMATSRQIKRYESITRSPVYSAVPSTMEGLSTIRAFEAGESFKNKFLELQDDNTRIYFMFLCVSRWLGFRLDVWTSIFIVVVAFLVVALRNSLSFVEPSRVGLILSYLVQLTGSLQWCARQSGEVENLMVSAERVFQYTVIPREEEMNNSNPVVIEPPKEWPTKGTIQLENVSLTYPSNEKPVLKNLNLSIPGGVRVGIVGRTGAGKSSMLQALFRLVEPAGAIYIDGVKTANIPLQTLRSRISIIPQEPFCFKGTIRFNIDPFSEASDDELWHVLKIVSLDKTVKTMEGELDSQVEENGSNLSVGERQLVCLARAMIRKSYVVVMDEATSNVDMHIDEIIQDSIRDGIFGKATVISIAHRLQTVAEYDFIVVLEAGNIIEVGNPWELLNEEFSNDKKDSPTGTFKIGSFASMVNEMADDAAQVVRDMARARYNKMVGPYLQNGEVEKISKIEFSP